MKMTPLLYARAMVLTLETQLCRKKAPRPVEFNFLTKSITTDKNAFRRSKEQGQIYKGVSQIFLIFALQ